MKNGQNNGDKTGRPKWSFGKTLLGAGLLLLIGFTILIVSSQNDNAVGVGIGLAFLPGAGLFITPHIVLSAVRESRTWEERAFKDKHGKLFKGQLLREDFFTPVEDTSPYHDMLLKGVIREALLNASVLLIVLFFGIVAGIFLLINGPYGPHLGIMELREFNAETFLMVLGGIILMIPIFAYNITCSICRVLVVRRGEHFAYRAVVKDIDNYEMRIEGKDRIYRFKYCKCLGIREKEIDRTEAILLFVPDEVYLIPENKMKEELKF